MAACPETRVLLRGMVTATRTQVPPELTVTRPRAGTAMERAEVGRCHSKLGGLLHRRLYTAQTQAMQAWSAAAVAARERVRAGDFLRDLLAFAADIVAAAIGAESACASVGSLVDATSVVLGMSTGVGSAVASAMSVIATSAAGAAVGAGVAVGANVASSQPTVIVDVSTKSEPDHSRHWDASSGGPDPEAYKPTDVLPHPPGPMSHHWPSAL